jgi:D-alanyl-D-alanine carboxypeptidase (penicillin-binding protein 5/6)
VSPDGYDMPGQVSSAYDLTLFAREGLQNADFRDYCSTVTAQFPGEWKKNKQGKPTTVRESFAIQNTNRLLSGDYDMSRYQGIAGVKNGDTTNAGATFTGVAQRGGRTLLVTVMSPARRHNLVYREAASLLDWGFKAAPTVKPVGTLVPPLSKLPHPSPSTAQAPAAGSAHPTEAAAASLSGGVWKAGGVALGTAILFTAVVIVVRRRRPLPSQAPPYGRSPAPSRRRSQEAPPAPSRRRARDGRRRAR